MKRAIIIAATAIIAAQLVFAQASRQQTGSRPAASTRNDATARNDDDDTITIDSALVNTHVSVRDRSGHSVAGLSKDVFLALEDARDQPIVHSSQDSSQPLRFALVIDRSRSVKKVFESTLQAARSFFGSILRPGTDRACVVAFDSSVYLTQDFTDDV